MTALRVAEGATLVDRTDPDTTAYGPTFHNWNVGPYAFLVSLRFAALGLLAQHPGSGYDLLKRFEQSMANVWPATQSQLYGELNKLADAGLIEVSDIGPRGRKEYRVTDAGRAELVRWITNPARRSAHAQRPTCCACSCSARSRPTQARELRRQRSPQHADAELKRLEHLRDSARRGVTATPTSTARAALEYGLRDAAMEARVGALAGRRRSTSGSQELDSTQMVASR